MRGTKGTGDPILPAAGSPSAARGRPRDPAADERILASAFRQLIDVGFSGLSIEAVAADAGVAKTTIYRRYPTKADLAIAAMSVEVPFVPPPADLAGKAALEAFIRQAIGILIDSGAVRILGSLLVEEAREPGLLQVFRERVLGPRRGLVDAMLRRGIDRGEFRSDIDPLIVTEMIAGAIYGHHVILGLPTTETWIGGLVDHVWAAVRAREGG